MSRHPKADEWRALRRCVLSGHVDEARTLLERMHRTYPEDAEVAEELARMNAGKPLRVTENKRQRTARAVLEGQQSIAAMLRSFSSPQAIACSHTPELQMAYRDLRMHIKVLKSAGQPAPQGTRSLSGLLKKELSRRRKKSTRSRVVRLVVLGVFLLALVSLILILRGRADNLASQLSDAVSEKNWERADGLLKATDTGINRLVHGGVASIAEAARHWRQAVLRESGELTRRMQLYEKLEAVSSLSLEERARFLRRIRALPAPFAGKLMAQWDELCRPEREILEQQKRDHIKRFSEPFPAPKLTGETAEDLPRLQEAMRHLTGLMNDFQDAKDIFGLEDRLIAPHRETLRSVQSHINDMEQFSRALALIGTARSYDEHKQALADLKPVVYPPALRAAQIVNTLDKNEASVFAMIRGQKYKLPVVGENPYPDYVMKAILEGGPTFSEKAPATAEQVALMEDVFTSRTLTRRLYELTSHDGRVNFSDEKPELTDEKNVRFNVSILDPEYSVSSPKREWPYPQAVRMRVVDATILLKSTGIERSLFFLRANLPDLLGRITAVHDASCPALAKAYMYDTLLRLLIGHENRQVTGLRFSPMLRRDMQSFLNLGKSLKYPLSVTCWLSRDAASLRAEEAYAAWFKEHADRNYLREMGANLRKILYDKPEYIGYVDERGNVCCKRNQSSARGEFLYYFSGGQLISSPVKDMLHSPDVFSPVFRD